MTNLDHVQITAPPGAQLKMAQFYKKLGLTPAEAPPSTELDVIWFVAGTAMIHIAFVEWHEPQRTPHIAVRVHDVEACRAELGVDTANSPTGIAGTKVIDPAGNTVELLPAARYDRTEFLSFAEHLDDPLRSQVHWACEKPALRAAAGPIAGLKVIDFGCGVGDFTRKLFNDGASQVVGTDIAPSAITIARERNPGPTYLSSTSPTLDLIGHGSDLVVSSLVMHYIEEWGPVLRRFRAWLRLGGRLVLSILHPFETALERGADPTRRFLYGRVTQADTTEVVGQYQLTGHVPRPVEIDLDGTTTTVFHHGFSTILSTLHAAEFRIEELIEPGPDPKLQQVDRRRYEQWQRHPKVLIVAATAA